MGGFEMMVKTRPIRPNETPRVTLDKEGDTLAVLCGWFARCDRDATGVTSHPILGDVPTCDRCRTFAEGK